MLRSAKSKDSKSAWKVQRLQSVSQFGEFMKIFTANYVISNENVFLIYSMI